MILKFISEKVAQTTVNFTQMESARTKEIIEDLDGTLYP